MSQIIVVGCNDKSMQLIDLNLKNGVKVHWFVLPIVLNELTQRFQYQSAIQTDELSIHSFDQHDEFSKILTEPKDELHVILTAMEMGHCNILKALTPFQLELDHLTGYAHIKFTDIGEKPNKNTTALHYTSEIQ